MMKVPDRFEIFKIARKWWMLFRCRAAVLRILGMSDLFPMHDDDDCLDHCAAYNAAMFNIRSAIAEELHIRQEWLEAYNAMEAALDAEEV